MGCFINTYEIINMGALKSSLLYKLHIFQCMGKLFIVVMQRVHWKFNVKIPYQYIGGYSFRPWPPSARTGIIVGSLRHSVGLLVRLSIYPSVRLFVCLYVRPERRSRSNSLRISAISLNLVECHTIPLMAYWNCHARDNFACSTELCNFPWKAFLTTLQH